MKILKEPILHFLVIGVLLYITYQSFNNYLNRGENVIYVKDAEISQLEQSWEMRWNRPPTPEERKGIVKQYIREKVLYKTALEMGLDRDDLVIQRRMVQKVEFLGADHIKAPQPSETDLLTYYDKHKAKYLQPEVLTMTQIFFDPDKRDQETLKDANKVLKELNAMDGFPVDLTIYGDVFMLQNYYPNKTDMEIRKLFGSGFTESVFELETGKWFGPVLSGYGTHLVFVHEHIANAVPEFSAVRENVKADWMDEMQTELEERYINGLLARYEIVMVED